MGEGRARLDAALIKVAGIGLNENDQCLLVVGNDVGIALALDSRSNQIYLASDVCRVDDAGPDFYKGLACLNVEPSVTGGMALGLRNDHSTLVALRQCTPVGIDGSLLQNLIDDIASNVRAMRRHLLDMLTPKLGHSGYEMGIKA